MKVNDNITFEYEERSMLSEEIYQKLLNLYINSDYKDLKIKNIYFDNKQHTLTESGIVLRKRYTNDSIEITLKTKKKNYDEEINHIIDIGLDIQNCLNTEILNKLEKLKIYPSDLIIVGEISVNRREIKHNDYLLVLDKNCYSNIIDYNIEIESSSRTLSKKILENIIKKFGINFDTKYMSKSRRAICFYKQ